MSEIPTEGELLRIQYAAAAKLFIRPLGQLVRAYHDSRGWPQEDIGMLMLGLVEEVGELAEVVNLHTRSGYFIRPEKQHRLGDFEQELAHELGDVLTYLYAIANHFGVVPSIETQWTRQLPAFADADTIVADANEQALADVETYFTERDSAQPGE